MPFIEDDIVGLRHPDGTESQLFWGDRVERVETAPTHHVVRVMGLDGPIAEGRVAKSTRFRDDALLRLSMIDVQQGDGLILETPGGKTIFIDGGDNQLFARHVAARFRGTSADRPLVVDLMLVTHGDADHFSGLVDLRRSESDGRPNKRVFVAPRRYYHNGIVKRPGEVAGRRRRDLDLLGPTVEVDGRPFVTGLVDDPGTLPKEERNRPFQAWTETLDAWEPRVRAMLGEPIERRRLDQHAADAFDFLHDEAVRIELLGPISEPTPAGPGLRFLRDPPDDAGLMTGTSLTAGGSWSASHTINGHSITFRVRLGNVALLFTGDVNQEAAARLRAANPEAAFRAEILKAPHHGSADFDMAFLEQVAPVVSLVSSGDESPAKEYIHPRATLMAALGKASRSTPALIFSTELAAFFRSRGPVGEGAKRFFAFERTNFGIVHVRTDGKRVLAFTHSGKAGLNEAYRFTVSATGGIAFAPRVTKRATPARF